MTPGLSHLEKIGVTYKTHVFPVRALRKRPELTVSEKLEQTHPMGSWAGRLGELVSFSLHLSRSCHSLLLTTTFVTVVR